MTMPSEREQEGATRHGRRTWLMRKRRRPVTTGSDDEATRLQEKETEMPPLRVPVMTETPAGPG